MRPRVEYLELFKEIVLDAWSQRHEHAGNVREQLERRIKNLRSRKDVLVDAFLYQKKIDQHTYDEQKDKLEEEIALARLELHDAHGEELDIEAVLAFAEYALKNPGRLWLECASKQKLAFQRLVFPRRGDLPG